MICIPTQTSQYHPKHSILTSWLAKLQEHQNLKKSLQFLNVGDVLLQSCVVVETVFVRLLNTKNSWWGAGLILSVAHATWIATWQCTGVSNPCNVIKYPWCKPVHVPTLRTTTIATPNLMVDSRVQRGDTQVLPVPPCQLEQQQVEQCSSLQ